MKFKAIFNHKSITSSSSSEQYSHKNTYIFYIIYALFTIMWIMTSANRLSINYGQAIGWSSQREKIFKDEYYHNARK